MAKCHKGNTRHRCKKREKYVNDFYAREQELNRLINNFIKDYKHLNPFSISEYKKMDKNRLEIKRLLSLQGDELWKQSHRRKRFYHKQLNKFKYHGNIKHIIYTYMSVLICHYVLFSH